VVQEAFNMVDVHNVSMLLLEELEAEQIDSNLAQAAAALTLVRLSSPEQPLEPEKEIAGVKALMDYMSFYFIEGKVN
jgi:hypothetical protein